jgi:large repetitive protein
MKKLVSVLTIATFLSTMTFAGTASAAPAPKQGTGQVSGTAQDPSKNSLACVGVLLRNVSTSQLAGTTTSAGNGAFSFTGLNAGSYVAELIDADGKVIGVSASISVGAGAAIRGVTVAVSTAGATAGPASAATAPKQGGGQVSGTAQDSSKKSLSCVGVLLRNVSTGQLAGTTTSAANGAFSFTGLNAGNYVVEIVNAAGQVIGTSAAVAVGAGSVIAGVTVAASATGALAGAAAAGGLGAFFTSTGGVLVLVGVGAGVTAGVVALANNNASPSR